MNGDGIVPLSDVDTHRYRLAGITKLAVAVLERAIRDAELVEVGHRVTVCRMSAWSEREQREFLVTRRWLQDASDPILRLWTSGAGMDVTQFTERVRRRVEWTAQLESSAQPLTRPPRSLGGRGLDSPFRRISKA